MKYFIQIKDWYITDCINYKHWDYIEIETDEKIDISWYMTYSNWVIWIDEIKKSELEELRIQAELEMQNKNEESQKNTLIEDMKKQLKSIESEALQNKLQWETAQHIDDIELRETKLAKINLDWEEIRSKYNATIKFMKEELWLLNEDLV